MIETERPQDLRKYKVKLFGPFTTRQAISVLISGMILFPLLAGINKFNSYISLCLKEMLDTPEKICCAVFIAIPICIGFVTIQGMPAEDWFREIFLRSMNRKLKIRPKANPNFWKDYDGLQSEGETINDMFAPPKTKEYQNYQKKMKRQDKKIKRRSFKNKKYTYFL